MSSLFSLLHVFAVFNLLALESAHLWWCLVDWNVVLGRGILQGCSVSSAENHKATEGPSQGLNAVEDVKVLLASMQNVLQLSSSHADPLKAILHVFAVFNLLALESELECCTVNQIRSALSSDLTSLTS